MPPKKIDYIIEAIRYTPDGKIDLVRLYQRRGAIWTDSFLLSRAALVQHLDQGKQVYTGRRLQYLGSQLEPGKQVHIEQGVLSTEGQAGAYDLLPGLPVF